VIYLVFALVVLLLASLLWRAHSVAQERENTNAERGERVVALAAAKAAGEQIKKMLEINTEASDLLKQKCAEVIALEKEIASLRLELQKYEDGAKRLGRLGRLS
jgi:type II secretory pathway component PulK